MKSRACIQTLLITADLTRLSDMGFCIKRKCIPCKYLSSLFVSPGILSAADAENCYLLHQLCSSGSSRETEPVRYIEISKTRVTMRDWLTWLWRQRSPTVCSCKLKTQGSWWYNNSVQVQRSGNPRKWGCGLITSVSLSLKAQEPRASMSEGRRRRMF